MYRLVVSVVLIMQSLVGLAIIAVVAAILILLFVILFGVVIGYRDEIVQRRLDLYAKAVFILVITAVMSYLFMSGDIGLIDLFSYGLLIVLLISCIDWSRLGKEKSDEYQKKED